MPYYRRRPLNEASVLNPGAQPAALIGETAALTRRLMPFPGAEALQPESIVSNFAAASTQALTQGLTQVPAEAMAQAPMQMPLATPMLELTPARASTSALASTLTQASTLVQAGTPVYASVLAPAATQSATQTTQPGAGSVAVPYARASTLTDEASALLPRAAGILDEEMARGVLAARSMTPGSNAGPAGVPALPGLAALDVSPLQPGMSALIPGSLNPATQAPDTLGGLAGLSLPAAAGTGDFTKDLYAFVERFATLMPRLSGSAGADAADGLPTLRAAAPVAPGQTATLSMGLHNEEARAVVLRPLATALISEEGAQLPAHCIECSQSEIALAPGQQHRLQLKVSIPAGSAPGRYTGLLVVCGVAQLQAILCVDVRTSSTPPTH